MALERKKRPPRIPLSQEEVAQLVAYKKIKEARKLSRFRRSGAYKLFNTFNVICFFAYWEILFCFFGPCHYQTHYSVKVVARHGDELNASGKRITTEIDILGVSGKEYKFLVNDFVEQPERFSEFSIGKDYILQKELKGMFEHSDKTYYIQAAGSLLFLAVLMIIISFTSFVYNLNENAYSLNAITAVNGIVFSGIFVL